MIDVAVLQADADARGDLPVPAGVQPTREAGQHAIATGIRPAWGP